MEYVHATMPSPVGLLTLVASADSLVAVFWENDDPERTHIRTSTEDTTHPILLEAAQQLTEYFQKQRMVFTLKLAFIGTPFQQRVWEALLTIPYGETRTYGQIAQQINSPGAVRAVGGAANKNPLSIIAPCHRVVGASGKLVGFAGGLAAKSILLQLEDSVKNPTLWD